MSPFIQKIAVSAVLVFGLILLQNPAIAEERPEHDQTAASEKPGSLTLIDEGGDEHRISPGDFSRLLRQRVNVTSHGAEAEFSGVPLVDLLQSVGVKFGSELRGKRTPSVAILEATDGYRVVISLLEIDPSTTDRQALIADQRDNKPLDSQIGPYRLVIPGDKREVRWIRNLSTIRVLNLKDQPLRAVRKGSSDD